MPVNNCWFKNEYGKKPVSNLSNKNLLNSILKKQSLYHYNCHCKEQSINVPSVYNIDVVDVRPKFNDFFKRKKGILYGIGYTYKDEMDIINTIQRTLDEVFIVYKSNKREVIMLSFFVFMIILNLLIKAKNS